MIRLTEDDSARRIEDASERHMRLCTQKSNAGKYKEAILPLYNDLVEKRALLKAALTDVKAAQDVVTLFDDTLDVDLRNLNGRAKEFDRNNPGSNTAALLFPTGVTNVITMPVKEEPDMAHSIAQKVIALGKSHELFPFADKIETAVADCRNALAQQVAALQKLGDAKTAVSISKIALVRQYNANYFIAASDVNKAFAESLFPQLKPARKKNGSSGENSDTEEKQ